LKRGLHVVDYRPEFTPAPIVPAMR
jgi:hypothetical protein